jgi:hypothetical protein
VILMPTMSSLVLLSGGSDLVPAPPHPEQRSPSPAVASAHPVLASHRQPLRRVPAARSGSPRPRIQGRGRESRSSTPGRRPLRASPVGAAAGRWVRWQCPATASRQQPAGNPSSWQLTMSRCRWAASIRRGMNFFCQISAWAVGSSAHPPQSSEK